MPTLRALADHLDLRSLRSLRTPRRLSPPSRAVTCLASRSRSTTLATRAASVGTTPTAPLAATAARLPLAVAAAGRRPVRAAAGSSSRTSPATSRGRYGLDLSLAIPFPTPLSSSHLRPRRMVEMDAEPSACMRRRTRSLATSGRTAGRSAAARCWSTGPFDQGRRRSSLRPRRPRVASSGGRHGSCGWQGRLLAFMAAAAAAAAATAEDLPVADDTLLPLAGRTRGFLTPLRSRPSRDPHSP
jgi:hypothetical protein